MTREETFEQDNPFEKNEGLTGSGLLIFLPRSRGGGEDCPTLPPGSPTPTALALRRRSGPSPPKAARIDGRDLPS